MKKVSAIVVNWNGRDVTKDCIESLLEQDYPDLEIIISDNGSTDGSVEILRGCFPLVKWVENGENLGFGPAVNRGIEVGLGDYFIFLNNDLVLQKDAIRELVRVLDNDNKIGAVVPKILYYEKPDTINSFGVRVNYTGVCCPNLIGCKDSDDLKSFETACGGIFMFRRDVFKEVGGFDPNLFLYHEDHDLSWRIRLAGWSLQVLPSAVIHHRYQFNKGVFKLYSSEKNRLFLLLKNLKLKTLFLIYPSLVVVEISQLAHAMFNGWFGLKIKSYIEILALLPHIIDKRRDIQLSRRVSDREIVRLYEGELRVGGLQNPILDYVLSPLLNLYWKLIRRFI